MARHRALHATCLIAAGWIVSACVAASTAQTPDPSARSGFLLRLDAALAARVPSAIRELADTKSWRAAGYPEFGDAGLILPSAPLVRARDLSPFEVLYHDGEDRTWRAQLRFDDSLSAWSVVLRPRLCPRGGMPRGRPWESAEPPAVSSDTWTILECWPLPK